MLEKSFEDTYPHYPFSVLVGFAIAVAAMIRGHETPIKPKAVQPTHAGKLSSAA